MATLLVVAAAIAVEIVVLALWRSSEGSDWWQRIALFIVGVLVITALLHYGMI